MRRFKKIKWKNIISTVLVGVLLVGAIAGLSSIFGKDTITIRSTAFSVGAIDSNGNYEKSDLSIYTDNLFECDGLTIEPDFKATGTFEVFYYNSEKEFVVSSGSMDAVDGVYEISDTITATGDGSTSYEDVTYARVMITPAVPTDDDGKEVKNFKIRFYEVSSYANDYKITVDK